MSQSQIVFVALIFILSCGTAENSNKESSEQPVQADTLTKSESTIEPAQLPDTVATVANEPNIEPVSPSNQFAGTTYFLTSDYDLENCENLSRCDCCTSEIAFLDDDQYAYMFVCEASTTFLKGNYKLDSNRLTLNHDSIIVNDEQPMFAEEGEELDTTQYGVFVYRQFVKPLEFEISSCNQRTLIQTVNNKNKDYGTEGSRTSSSLRSILFDPSSEITRKLEID